MTEAERMRSESIACAAAFESLSCVQPAGTSCTREPATLPIKPAARCHCKFTCVLRGTLFAARGDFVWSRVAHELARLGLLRMRRLSVFNFHPFALMLCTVVSGLHAALLSRHFFCLCLDLDLCP